MSAANRAACAGQADPANNLSFRRRWTPEPFIQVGDVVDGITRRLAIEAVLRLVEKAEACDRPQDRRAMVNAATQILREAGLTPADLTKGRAA